MLDRWVKADHIRLNKKHPALWSQQPEAVPEAGDRVAAKLPGKDPESAG